MFKHLAKRRWWRSVLTFVTLMIGVGVVSFTPRGVRAQDGQNLPFDALQLGVVNSPDGTLFNFAGQAGDAVEIEVSGLNNFAPIVLLQGADRAELAREDNASRSDSVSLSATLPASGTFFVVVTGADNTVGQFTILLTRGLPVGFPLIPNGVTEGIVDPAIPQIYYDLPLDGTNNTRLEVRSQTIGYSPQVTVFGADGTVIALITGNRALAAALEFGPGTETLKVLVALGEFTNLANFQVLWTVVTPIQTTPAATQEPADGTSGACQVSPGGSNLINVRAGGSTDHPRVGVLQVGETAVATGFSALNGGWYEIQLPNGTVGWVSSSVVSTTGNCSALPVKTFAPASTGDNGAPTETATAAPPEGTQEPSDTETSPTPTEEAGGGAQTAIPDNEPRYSFELNFKSTNQADRARTVSDVISYPDGDNADRVRYELTGFDSVTFGATATVTVICSGPGAENAMVRWNWGSAAGVPCSQATRTFTHTVDSDFTNFEIYLASGTNAYVTWTATVVSAPQ